MMSIPLSRYTTLCIFSTLLALCTIALLLFSSTGDKTDNNYIYLSLAAPTFALAHHLFYFVAPFERWAVAGLEDEKVEYHIVHEAPPAYSSQNNVSQNNTPNTNQNASTQNGDSSSRKVYVHATRQPISNTYNPLASSTLNILTLVLLAVCIGALALSTGTVAFIDTLDALAAEKQGELEQRIGNGTHMGFGLGAMPLDCYSGVVPVETSAVEAIPQVTSVPEVEAVEEEEKEETPVEEYTPVDPSAPPRPILFYQATLSLLQTLALGYMALTAMRIRTLRYDGEGSYAWAEDELEELGGEVVFEEEEEEDWEVQWVRASEDSRDEEDKQL